MHLALGRARTDCAPRHQVRDVLRSNHVEELTACRQAELIDIEQQTARDSQTFVDVEAAVQVGIVDESLPAYGGTWLFKINTHDDFERVLEAFPLKSQLAC